jgi:hypothetical protein
LHPSIESDGNYIEIRPRGTIFIRSGQFIACAADEAIIGRTAEVLNEVLTQLPIGAISARLVIHNDKTTRKPSKETIIVDNIFERNFEKTNTFKHLGSIMISQNEK